jgi:hypothetical protein
MHALLRAAENNDLLKFGMTALINYQFHLIARVDDVAKLLVSHIRVHNHFPHLLKTRLNWSKNVNEERDAPWQIVIGSMDPVYCVVLGLAWWLEMNLMKNPSAMLSPYVFSFSSDIEMPSGSLKSKNIAQKIFRSQMFKREEFTSLEEGGLGSHSIRKYAASHARGCMMRNDDIDTRGRWKCTKRVSNVYVDVLLPYVDAKVAEKLCIGGPCYYLFPEEVRVGGDGVVDVNEGNLAVMRAFILSKVVPNIRQRFSESVSLIFGKAILWSVYCHDDIIANYLPQDQKERIKLALLEITPAASGEDALWNPIVKAPVVITGDEGKVFIDIIPDIPVDGGGDDGNAVVGGMVQNPAGGVVLGDRGLRQGSMESHLLALHSTMVQIRRDLHELRTNQMGDRVSNMQHFNILNGNIRRYAHQPFRRLVRGQQTEPAGWGQQPRGQQPRGQQPRGQQPGGQPAGGGGGADGTAATDRRVGDMMRLVRQQEEETDEVSPVSVSASLTPTLRNLHDVWDEYINGIGGRKAARLFTYRERGRVKHKYSRRKVIWDLISGLVREGYTSQVAIDKIYAAYGEGTSVTEIIDRIRKDKKNNTLNPNLRI